MEKLTDGQKIAVVAVGGMLAYLLTRKVKGDFAVITDPHIPRGLWHNLDGMYATERLRRVVEALNRIDVKFVAVTVNLIFSFFFN
jgi:hypothetical protein